MTSSSPDIITLVLIYEFWEDTNSASRSTSERGWKKLREATVLMLEYIPFFLQRTKPADNIPEGCLTPGSQSLHGKVGTCLADRRGR